jgi:hypothetical protein
MSNNKNKDTEEDMTDSEKKLMSEWDQHMSDFIPEDLSTIIVDPRTETVRILPTHYCYRHSMKILVQNQSMSEEHISCHKQQELTSSLTSSSSTPKTRLSSAGGSMKKVSSDSIQLWREHTHSCFQI